MDAVRIENVSFSYGGEVKKSLDCIDLSLKKGEFTVISGDAKSGKSSLIYLVSGIIPFFYSGKITGRVSVYGSILSGSTIDEIRRKVKTVLSNPYAQLSGMASTVFEEVALGIGASDLNGNGIKEKVEEALCLTGIIDLKKRDPSTLSGGETQRMVIAGKIVSDSEILLLDEPVSKLDPEGKTDIFRLAEKLSSNGKTIIISSNETGRAAEYADRIVVLSHGKIVKNGSAREVSSDPEIRKYGVELQRYTDIAIMGMEKGLWDRSRRLPSKFEEALEGFKWISE